MSLAFLSQPNHSNGHAVPQGLNLCRIKDGVIISGLSASCQKLWIDRMIPCFTESGHSKARNELTRMVGSPRKVHEQEIHGTVSIPDLPPGHLNGRPEIGALA